MHLKIFPEADLSN